MTGALLSAGCYPCSLQGRERRQVLCAEHANNPWSLRRDASDDRYEFELENQAGSAVRLGEDDRRALVTGLALHEKARRTLTQVSASTAL